MNRLLFLFHEERMRFGKIQSKNFTFRLALHPSFTIFVCSTCEPELAACLPCELQAAVVSMNDKKLNS